MSPTFGIIGFGTIGRLCFDTLRAKGAVILGIVDPGVSTRHVNDVPVFDNYAALLQTTVEAIIVATPPSSHFEIGMAALHAGKHVFLEKPPARSVRQADELRALAASRQRTLFFGYHARFNKSVELASAELRNRRVESFSAVYKENVLDFHGTGWVLQEGVLRDSGINVFSILTAILPSALQLQVVDATVIVSAALVHLQAWDGVTGSIDLDWRHSGPEQRTIEAVSEHKTFLIDISRDQLRIDDVPVYIPDSQPGLKSEYGKMLESFTRCVQIGESSCGTNEIRLMETAREMAL